MTDALQGRVAVVTGANHGIGAATAALLADRGAAVVATYLRVDDVGEQAGTPASYGQQRARTPRDVVGVIRTAGGRAISLEADLVDPAAPGRIFDAAEVEFGPVEILINNASSCRQDSFVAVATDSVGRRPDQVTVESITHNLSVDVIAAGLLIA